MESIQNEMLIRHARNTVAAAKRDMGSYCKHELSLEDMLGSLRAMCIALGYKFMLR